MKKKLKGAYYFEWLGRIDRRNLLRPYQSEDRHSWPEWANTSYVFGYWSEHKLINPPQGE